MTVKVCCRCKSELSIEDFHRHKGKPDGRAYHCKICAKSRKPCKRNPEVNYSGHIKRTYGLSQETYNQILTHQSSGCAICGFVPEDGQRRLEVDHCHKTGDVRSLLCKRCNLALGYVDDDISLLVKMIDYILRHESL